MSRILEKIKEKGIAGSLKAAPRKIYWDAKLLRHRQQRVRALADINNRVEFLHEGHISIELPKFTNRDILFGDVGIIEKLHDFSVRPNKEVLLRKLVFDLFEQGYLDRSKSIIDIGCWIADNALVWSKMLKDGGVVHAIDPSPNNLAFGRKIASLNNINNVNWVEGVCAEEPGIVLDFQGGIDHTSFQEAQTPSQSAIVSTTLDEIVSSSSANSISLIHVDVEGFEEKVLRGANEIIARDKPVILFEQHIGEDNTMSLVRHLQSLDYQVFMINEALPGCQLDCRNLIAFDNARDLPKPLDVNHTTARADGIWFATLSEALIPIT